MRQIKATVPTLAFIYGEAFNAVQKGKGRCPKCWGLNLSQRAFRCNQEVYTLPCPDGSGLWVFDVDKARALIGDRVDGEVPPETLLATLGEFDAGHELCLIRRGLAGHKTSGPPGILCPTPLGIVLIDGTHRGRLCIGAGVPLIVGTLTDAEAEQVIMTRPPNAVSVLQGIEMGRMADAFASMDADAFFEEVAAVIGKRRLTELLGEQS